MNDAKIGILGKETTESWRARRESMEEWQMREKVRDGGCYERTWDIQEVLDSPLVQKLRARWEKASAEAAQEGRLRELLDLMKKNPEITRMLELLEMVR